jgi:demethylmenaquinone methyltransferase/2-methoxy-6-polyprenyl-1,4-benzoquinol methylase
MLSIGHEKIKKEGLAQAELIHGNAMDLPFPDDTFDYVTIGFGLRNVPDYLAVLKEMTRVAKPGGQIICLETSQPTLIGFKQLYFFYFQFIMPLFGKVFAKSYSEYSWLQESARSFPGMKELAGLFEEAGLKHVNYHSFTGGVAATHIGWKDEG